MEILFNLMLSQSLFQKNQKYENGHMQMVMIMKTMKILSKQQSSKRKLRTDLKHQAKNETSIVLSNQRNSSFPLMNSQLKTIH